MKEPMGGDTKKIPSEPFAVVTLVALLAGVGFCISTTRGKAIAAAIAGGVATASMLILKMRMDAEIMKEASGMPVTVDYLIGFWIVCLASIAGLVFSILRAKEKETG